MLDFDLADDGYLAELAGLVAIPSVSRDAAPETMRAAAQWVADQLRFAGGRLAISVVAEGVETVDQVAGLKMLGCQVAQGFYFSRPLRAEEFDELLTRHFARTAGPAVASPASPVG
jgi:predicted signal transduction protein with EAL and GGDEF domain